MIEKKSPKIWPEEKIKEYVGNHIDSYISYASDSQIRQLAASGGTVSALLIFALEKKFIDGAVVCKTVIESGKVRPQFIIAKTKEEILLARGSKYVAAKFAGEAIPLIREYQGNLAVVGLPCDIAILKRLLLNDPFLSQKVIFTIALFCGHNSQTELIDHVAARLEKQANSNIKSYHFRIGHWRGKLQAAFENGETIGKKFGYFSLYQNLYFFAEKKCLFCNDHFGYGADISVGDLWSLKYKNDPQKYSGVIVKTEKGQSIFDRCIRAGFITGRNVSIDNIINGQKRTALFHYNLSARHKAGKLFGMRIPEKSKQKVNLLSLLAAFLVVFNWRWSQNKHFSWLIWRIPREILKLYLYFFKALESLNS